MIGAPRVILCIFGKILLVLATLTYSCYGQSLQLKNERLVAQFGPRGMISLEFKRVYSSVREHAASFVGFYADLSMVQPDTPHTIQLVLPKLEPGRFKGVFFDNVETEYTEQLAP